MASFPYAEDEPLQLVSALNKEVSNKGGRLQAALEATVEKIQERCSGTPAPAGASKDPRDSETLEQLHKRLEKECEAALVISILLATKLNIQVRFCVVVPN